MNAAPPKIGRRTALWHALRKEGIRRNELGLPFVALDHNQVAQQIAVAGFREDLWTRDPAELASKIWTDPYKIPEHDEIFQLELSIVFSELAPAWDEEMDFLLEAIARQPMQRRFTGEGIQI